MLKASNLTSCAFLDGKYIYETSKAQWRSFSDISKELLGFACARLPSRESIPQSAIPNDSFY